MKIAIRNIIFNKSQMETIDEWRGCMLPALLELDKDTVHTILIHEIREWEKMAMKRINDLKFLNPNDRMKAFDQVVGLFIARLNNAIVNPVSNDEAKTLRIMMLENYKGFLESQGYAVSYKIS